MKKLVIAAGIAALFTGVAMAETAEKPITSLTLNLSGAAFEKTCSITSGKNGSKQVDLPQIWTSDLDENKTAEMSFEIVVSNCTAIKEHRVDAKFSPPSGQVTAEGVLKSDQADTTNIGFVITNNTTDDTGNVLLEDAIPQSISLDEESDTGKLDAKTFSYKVKYAKVNSTEPAKAGKLTASLQFGIAYK